MSVSRRQRRLSLVITPELQLLQTTQAQLQPSVKESPSLQSNVPSSSLLSLGASTPDSRRNSPARKPGILVKTLSKRFDSPKRFLIDDDDEELKVGLSLSSSESEDLDEQELKKVQSPETDKPRPTIGAAVDLLYSNAAALPLNIDTVSSPKQVPVGAQGEFRLQRRHSFGEVNVNAFLQRQEPFNEMGWYYLAMKTKAHERVRRAFWAWTIWIQARRIAKFRYRNSCSKIRRYRNTFIGVKMKEWALRTRLPTENRTQRQARRSIQNQIKLSREPRTLQDIKLFAKKLESIQVEMPLLMQVKIWQESVPILHSFMDAYSREVGPNNAITIQARQRLALVTSKLQHGYDMDLTVPLKKKRT